MKERMGILRKITFLVLIAIMVLTTITVSVSAQDELDLPWGLGGLLGLSIIMLVLICLLIPLIIAILIAVWIYKDAEKRGKSGAVWVLILIVAALFLNFIGVIGVIILWLIVRPPIRGPGVGMVVPPQQPYYPPQQPYQQPPQYPQR